MPDLQHTGAMNRLSRFYWGTIAFLLPIAASAQDGLAILTSEGGCDYVTGRIQAKCVPILIGHLVQVIFSLIGVFFLLNVIYAGYEMMIGSLKGDTGGGKERLFWSIGGFVAAACSYLVIDLVITLAGA